MSGPFTVYPDPADNPYLIGVTCPYCGAEPDDRCVTSGGNVYGELCHKKRRTAAKAQGVSLRVVRPVISEPPVDLDIPDKVNALKLAFWFIDKMGGAKRARAYFESAVTALESLPEEPDR
jgi:hypothetical protein